MARTERLAKQLEAAAAFLDKCGSTSANTWAGNLRRIRDDLVATTSANQALALAELETYFGGMGSLNDYYLCEQNGNLPVGYAVDAANTDFGRILDECFRELRLLNASAMARTWWSILVWWHRKELPPRIKKSFRKTRAV